MRTLFLLALGLVVYGCSSGPTPEELLLAEAHEAVRQKLKDPDSARFDEPIVSSDPELGLVCMGKVNAKNSFGGYAGNEPYVFSRSKGAALASGDPELFIEISEDCTQGYRQRTERIRRETEKITR